MRSSVIIFLMLLLPFQLGANDLVNLKDHLNSRSSLEEQVAYQSESSIPGSEDRIGNGDEGTQHRGPFNSNLNPFSGRPHFLIMPAVTAEHLETGELRMRFGSNFDSIYQVHEENGYTINADYEITEVYALFDYQLTQNFQAGVILRSFHYAAGRADSDLNGFHDALGFDKGARGHAVNDQFSHIATKDGKTLYETKNNQLGLGDAILIFKAKAIDESKKLPAVSLMTAIKVPTGNRSLGYRSGSTDVGMAIAATKQISKNIKAHLNAGIAVPGNADDLDNLTQVYSFASALEYYFNEKISAVFQINYSTSPFAEYDFEGLNADSFTVGFGLQYRLENGMKLIFHFSDELYNNGDSDYEFGLAVDLAPYFFYPVEPGEY